MPRFGNAGKFDHRYELGAIFEGMQRDLQQFIGQQIPWYRFDAENSVQDPIYDVGNETGGRRFQRPFILPVIGADLEEGVEVNSGQGSYTTDIAHLVVSYDAAHKAGIRDAAKNWRLYLGDRFVYNDTVFQVRNIQVRGPVRDKYEVLGIDGWQVNAEELVNDPDFAKYAGPGDVTTAPMAEALIELDATIEKTPEADSTLTPATASIRRRPVDDIYGGPA